MTTIQTIAAELASALIADVRTQTGETFYKLADNSPDWMTGAIQEAHGGMMPDDTRYSMILETAHRIAGADDSEIEDSHEAVDGLVDIYTNELTRWLASNNNRAGYCDDALENAGGRLGHDQSLVNVLMWGQFEEYSEIWSSLVASLEAELEARES